MFARALRSFSMSASLPSWVSKALRGAVVSAVHWGRRARAKCVCSPLLLQSVFSCFLNSAPVCRVRAFVVGSNYIILHWQQTPRNSDASRTRLCVIFGGPFVCTRAPSNLCGQFCYCCRRNQQVFSWNFLTGLVVTCDFLCKFCV